MSAEYALQREMDAARLIRDQVRTLAGDDPDFIRDAIEGETNLLETVEVVTASLQDDVAMSAAIAQRIGDLQGRRDRIDKRVESKRAILCAALGLAERPKLETPSGTVSLRPVPPKADIVEEADIPGEFWKAQPPKLDRKAVLDRLKAGEPVPGARLTNGSATIAIRT